MSAVAMGFSEQDVQSELQRITSDLVQTEQLEEAAAACERLASSYPESKWLGNALLLAATCYRKLGRGQDEARLLGEFASFCPRHPQAQAVRRALEAHGAAAGMQARGGGQNAAAEAPDDHFQALLDAVEDIKQRQAFFEGLTEALGRVSRRVHELEERGPGADDSVDGGTAQPTPVELMDAMVQDMRVESEARLQSIQRQLQEMNKKLAEVSGEGWLPRSARNMAVGAVAGCILCLVVGVGLYGRRHAPPQKATLGNMGATLQRAGRPALDRIGGAKRAAPRVVIARTMAPVARRARRSEAARPVRRLQQAAPAVSATASVKVAATAKPAAVAPPTAVAKPAAGARSPKPSAGTYTVKPGDTLWKVSAKALGSGKAAEQIAALNGLTPPYNIRPGQTLRLPK